MSRVLALLVVVLGLLLSAGEDLGVQLAAGVALIWAGAIWFVVEDDKARP